MVRKVYLYGDKINKSILGQIKDSVGYNGISSDNKQIAFVNLHEIRDINLRPKMSKKIPQPFIYAGLRDSLIIRTLFLASCNSSISVFFFSKPYYFVSIFYFLHLISKLLYPFCTQAIISRYILYILFDVPNLSLHNSPELDFNIFIVFLSQIHSIYF